MNILLACHMPVFMPQLLVLNSLSCHTLVNTYIIMSNMIDIYIYIYIYIYMYMYIAVHIVYKQDVRDRIDVIHDTVVSA